MSSKKSSFRPPGTGTVPSKTELGKFVHERRVALDLSQTQLAEKIGFSQNTVCGIEIGRLSGQNQIPSLAEAFKCEPQELKTLIPTREPQTELGKLLKELREEAGLSLNDLSAKTKLSRHTLLVLEKSYRNTLRQKTAQQFSKAFGVDISVFKDFYPRYQNGTGGGIGELGKFVRKRRLELGLTLEDIGQAIGGMSRESIRQLEVGLIIWIDNTEHRQKLAAVLKVQLEDLPATTRKLKTNKERKSPLGNFLIKKRYEAGFVQAKLAELTQLCLPTIGSAERIGKVSAKSLEKIAQALNCQIPLELVPSVTQKKQATDYQTLVATRVSSVDVEAVRKLTGGETNSRMVKRGIRVLRRLLEREKEGYMIFLTKGDDVMELDLLL